MGFVECRAFCGSFRDADQRVTILLLGLRLTGPRERASVPLCEETAAAQPSRPRYLSWAELMRRVFAIDVLECPQCGAPMRILAAIHPPKATRAILECLELPSRAPPVAPARPAGLPIGASPPNCPGCSSSDSPDGAVTRRPGACSTRLGRAWEQIRPSARRGDGDLRNRHGGREPPPGVTCSP
jgi:hypothetical protein